MEALHFMVKTFDSEVLGAGKPVLVDFWAPWCGPCRTVGPIIEELAADYAGKAIIGKVNVDEEGEISQRYKIMSIPTVMIFNKGQIVEKIIGARTKKDYAVLIDKYL